MMPPDMDINKGVELILRGERQPKPQNKPRFFDFKLSLFGREFRLSLDIKKKQALGGQNGNHCTSCHV